MFYKKRCSYKFQKTCKNTLAQVFSCEFCEISKNNFFTQHLWTAAFFLKKRLRHRCFPVIFVKFLRTPFLHKHLWTTASLYMSLYIKLLYILLPKCERYSKKLNENISLTTSACWMVCNDAYVLLQFKEFLFFVVIITESKTSQMSYLISDSLTLYFAMS